MAVWPAAWSHGWSVGWQAVGSERRANTATVKLNARMYVYMFVSMSVCKHSYPSWQMHKRASAQPLVLHGGMYVVRCSTTRTIVACGSGGGVCVCSGVMAWLGVA